MTTLLLGAAAYVVGLHGGSTSSLLVMAVLGAGVVLSVGLLGRAVAGPWVGVTAATLAALAPNFWMPSGILMSETPAMLLMALILLAVVTSSAHRRWVPLCGSGWRVERRPWCGPS